MDKEQGQKAREAYWGEDHPIPFADLAETTKASWARVEAAIEAPRLAKIERLKAWVAELERERDAIVAKLGETIELAGCPSDDDICAAFDALHRAKGWKREEPGTLAFFADGAKWAWKAALKTYHASLTQELPPDLPVPGRDRDAARIPDLNHDEHLDRPKPEQDHVHEVGSCSFCDRALRQRATPCLTWQGPEYGGRCRACGGSKEEHEGRAQ